MKFRKKAAAISGTAVTLIVLVGVLAFALKLLSISVSQASIIGGQSTTGTVNLAAKAPKGGATVTLASSNPAVSVPSSVLVPEGKNTASFPVTTQSVNYPVTVNLTATFQSSSKSTALTMNPPPAVLASISLGQTSLISDTSTTGTATLTANARSPVTVILSSGNTAAVTVPASVTIPTGSISATFPVTAGNVLSNTTTSISGTVNSGTQSASITVLAITLTSLTLNPTTITDGDTAIGTVTISGPAPAGGVVVTLSSDNPIAVVPPSVTIPAGQTTATFLITTVLAQSGMEKKSETPPVKPKKRKRN